MKPRLYVLLLLALTVIACQPMQKPLSTGQRIDLGLAGTNAVPDMFFYNQAGEVGVMLSNPHSINYMMGDTTEEMAYVTLDGTWKQLRLERKFACDYAIYYYDFQRLADGRLGILGYCFKIAPQRSAVYLLAHDEAQQTTELLIPAMLPIDDLGLFAWDPTLTRAMVSFGSLYEGLYWIDATGAAEPVTATIQADGKRFSLETAYVAYLQSREVVASTGNARAPAWSPDGSTIAFFASVDAIGRDGIDRIRDVSWLLCLMDAQTRELKVVLKDIYGVIGPRWSSDGRYIAFKGQLGARGSEGVWVYSVANGETRFIAEGVFGDVFWSADDRVIYAIRFADKNFEMDKLEVWQYEVGDVLSAP